MGSTSAFLSPIAYVGSEKLPRFAPDANPRDAALAWAIEHGGKNPTIEKALSQLERKLASKKLTPEDRALLQAIRQELAPYSGAVGIHEPKLGSFFQDPGKIEIPAPKQPGERGALPESTAQPLPMSDPEANLPPELQADPQAPIAIPRGQVAFDAETGRAVVTFFQSADVTTAPHELFHIFRREMERTALAADGSAHAKEQWRRINEFVGARDGQPWSREMEEKFADAGLRYLMEGRAPTPALQGVFDKLKSWFMEIFQKAEDIGVEISPQMRQVFDDMFTVPYDVADDSFRRAVGGIHSRQVEQEFAPGNSRGRDLSPEDEQFLAAERQGDLNMVEELTTESQLQAEDAVRRLERRDPELARSLMDENTRLELAEYDAQIEHVNRRDELRREAVECVVNGG